MVGVEEARIEGSPDLGQRRVVGRHVGRLAQRLGQVLHEVDTAVEIQRQENLGIRFVSVIDCQPVGPLRHVFRRGRHDSGGCPGIEAGDIALGTRIVVGGHRRVSVSGKVIPGEGRRSR